jgi:hypothetical protein
MMTEVEAADLLTVLSFGYPTITIGADRIEFVMSLLELYTYAEAVAAAKVVISQKPDFRWADLIAVMNAERRRRPKPTLTINGIESPGGPDGALLRGEIES